MLKLLLFTHIVAAALTTIVIFRLDYFERTQAIGQALIAWLVPILGAVLILIFQTVVHRNMTTRSQPVTEDHYRDEGLAVDLLHELKSDD